MVELKIEKTYLAKALPDLAGGLIVSKKYNDVSRTLDVYGYKQSKLRS
jgi:hypothetical protein